MRKPEKKIFRLGAGAFFLLAAVLIQCAVPAYGGEAVPLYSFEYQGSRIKTFATYSEVNGKKTDGCRYFVKDGNLLVVDNRLEPVPDGIFMYYEGGESYLAVLTRGGKIVSLGSIRLESHLKGFKNRGIADLAGNLNEGGSFFVVTYTDGTTVGYDVVSGEELFRDGAAAEGKAAEDPLEFIRDYLERLVIDAGSVSKVQGNIDAQRIADIMTEEGYSLDQLVEQGVFANRDSLENFVKTNEAEREGAVVGFGGTGTGSSEEADPYDSPDVNTENGDAGDTGGAAFNENGVADGTAADRERKDVDKNAAGEDSGTEKKDPAGKTSVDNVTDSEGGTGDSQTMKDEPVVIGSAVIIHTGKKPDQKDNTAETTEEDGKTGKTSEKDNGEKAGTQEKDRDEKTEDPENAARDVGRNGTAAGGSLVQPDPGKGTGTADGTSTANGTAGGGNVPTESQASGDRQKNGTNKETETSGESEENDRLAEEYRSEEKSGESMAEQPEKADAVSFSVRDRYITVYDPGTGSYEIYSQRELLENPEAPESENKKLGGADNGQIVSLLSAREDHNNDRGISLYIFVIAGVILLVALVGTGIKKAGSREEARHEEAE